MNVAPAKSRDGEVAAFKGIKLSFGPKKVLDGVDVSVPARESLVIMGASGSGKSTLLSLLLGLLEPDEGKIHFHDRELTGLSRKELNKIRPKIGMVYQNAALISSMTLAENVALPLEELSDKKPEEIRKIVEEKLDLVGLKDSGEKLPSELSGGMQKHAGLARALALDPELILFDEPSAGLDPVNSRMIDDLIIRLREEKQATSIIVTHEMDSAFYIATRMAFLHEGKMVFQGSPDDFRKAEHPAVKKFLSAYKDLGEGSGSSKKQSGKKEEPGAEHEDPQK
jgi:phospholipid/cholesterol/gamma-HCH transport system ATP-binding protein